MAHATYEPYPLTNACAKVDWAKCHLDDLREAVRDFCADSHTIATEEETEWDRVRYRVYLKQPHVSVYLICGDYLQCLRTALDQAIWSLINHRTGIDSVFSEFPVFEKPLDPKSELRFNNKLDGISAAALDYIKSIQPYNRPAGLPLSSSTLWCLHELNRIDKHRRISVQAQIALASREHFGLVVPGVDFAEISEEATDYAFDLVCKGAYKHLKPKISTFVIFGESKSGILMEIDDIAKLHDFVKDEVLVSLASRLN